MQTLSGVAVLGVSVGVFPPHAERIKSDKIKVTSVSLNIFYTPRMNLKVCLGARLKALRVCGYST